MSNSKIQDFREIDALKLMDFDLTPAANIFSTIERGVSGTQRVIQNQPENFFVALYLVREQVCSKPSFAIGAVASGGVASPN